MIYDLPVEYHCERLRLERPVECGRGEAGLRGVAEKREGDGVKRAGAIGRRKERESVEEVEEDKRSIVRQNRVEL